MNRRDYDVLVGYAGRHLDRPHPWPLPATTPFPLDMPAAVYVAVDDTGRCRYVGSVSRSSDFGLSQRIREHMAEPSKHTTWNRVWVLPLRATTPLTDVRRLEGVVGAHLGPSDNRRLPRPSPGERFRGPVRSGSGGRLAVSTTTVSTMAAVRPPAGLLVYGRGEGTWAQRAQHWSFASVSRAALMRRPQGHRHASRLLPPAPPGRRAGLDPPPHHQRRLDLSQSRRVRTTVASCTVMWDQRIPPT
jgi:hypothetical protein